MFKQKVSKVRTITFPVGGMNCNACASRVRATLDQTAGVRKATVSLSEGQVAVQFDSSAVTPQSLVERVREAGYAVPDWADSRTS